MKLTPAQQKVVDAMRNGARLQRSKYVRRRNSKVIHQIGPTTIPLAVIRCLENLGVFTWHSVPTVMSNTYRHEAVLTEAWKEQNP